MSLITGNYVPLSAKYIDGIDLHKLDAAEMNQLVIEWLAGLDVIKTLPNRYTPAATLLVDSMHTVLLDRLLKIHPKDLESVAWAKHRIAIYEDVCSKLEKTSDSDSLREAITINPLDNPPAVAE